MVTRILISRILVFALLAGVSAAPLFAEENSLLEVRIGTHKQFDRVVFELDEQASAQVTVKADQKIEVRFSGIRVSEHFALPSLPRDLTILKRIDAFREGESEAVFELTLAQDATPTELPLTGKPWRLAIDLAPRAAQASPPPPPKEEKPEYIPGDLPIPTKLAGQEVADDTTPESTDPAHAHAALAYFYQTRGDTQGAREQAQIYEKFTGKPLDLSTQSKTVEAAAPGHAQQTKSARSFVTTWMNKIRRVFIPSPWFLGAIFTIGLVGGLVLSRVLGGWRPPALASLKRKKHHEAERLVSQLEELHDGLEALDEAVAQEPPRIAAPEAPPSEPEPELVMQAEDEMKESLMDRRVRRVLELSREGRTISAIAEEMQMGQDEVKLILDLNQ